MTSYYWDKPDWPEKCEANIAQLVLGWEKDWGPFAKGVATRCGITLESALLYLICNKVHWWTEANVRYQEEIVPVVEHMRQEIQDLKDGDQWKKPDEGTP